MLIKRIVYSLMVFVMGIVVVTTSVAQQGDLSSLLEAETAGIPADGASQGNPPGSANAEGLRDDRSPVPPKDEVSKATRTVAGIYKPKLAGARRPSERTAVAKEMLGAASSINDKIERYALLQAALEVASTGDDLPLIQQIAKSLAREYRVSELALISGSLKALTPPATPEDWRDMTSMLKDVASRCLDSERYAEAMEVISVYNTLARRMRDPQQIGAATALRKQLADRKKASEKLRQLTDAIDRGEAGSKDLLEAGRILCFDRGDWPRGLRYLAEADDPQFSRVARLDLLAQTPEQRLAVAEAWVAAADTVGSEDSSPCLDRAVALLTGVIPKLAGLKKVKAEATLDAALQSANKGGRDPNAWIVVFRSSKPDVWDSDSPADPANFAVPLEQLPPNIKFLRIRRTNGDSVIIRMTKSAINTDVMGNKYGWNGTKANMFGALTLGILDCDEKVDGKTGQVAISRKGGSLSGWGFGHRVHHGGAAELCWASQWIPREMLEISVLTRSLTPNEAQLLLD